MKLRLIAFTAGAVFCLGNAFSTRPMIQQRRRQQRRRDLLKTTAFPPYSSLHAMNAAEFDRNDDDDDDDEAYMMQVAETAPIESDTLDRIRNHRASLQTFLIRVQQMIETTNNIKQATRYDDLVELRGVIKHQLQQVTPDTARVGSTKLLSSAVIRVEDVSFQVEEQPLRHDFDLGRFKDPVLQLFAWYRGKDKERYMAPYFPFVQSSGTGKTKLMWELCQDVNTKQPHPTTTKTTKHCKMILCGISDTPPDAAAKSAIFCHYLQVPLGKGDDDRINICQKLDSMIVGVTCNQIVLLFDEAQHLLSSNGFAFRCVRWWLRMIRSKKIVAVFTATTLLLTNLYLDPPESRNSRDAKLEAYHQQSGRSFYEPFYMIFTIGIFSKKRQMEGSAGLTITTEYEQAVPYGRPLFTLMQQKGRLEQHA